MRRSCLGLLVILCSVLLITRAARAETLYFLNGGTWNTVGNWYVAGPNNTLTLAGRIPNSGDDAVIYSGANCNATSTSPQLLSLTVQQTGFLTGGNFDVGTLSFAVATASSGGTNGLTSTRVTVRTAMNFNVTGTNINGSEIIMQGGSHALVSVGPTFSNTTIFNQGSFVMQPGTGITFLGSANRFDNTPGADIRGNGGVTSISGANLTFNNSGTIRADSGTLNISAGITWLSVDGTGSFYPFTSDAVINLQSAFTVPANTTTYFKGPGTVATLGNVTIDGTLQVGVPASGPISAQRGNLPAEPNGPATDAGIYLMKGKVTISGGAVINIEDNTFVDIYATAIEAHRSPNGISGKITVKKGGTLNVTGPNNNGSDTLDWLGGTLENDGTVTFRVREVDARGWVMGNGTDGTVINYTPLGIVSSGSPAPVVNNFGEWDAIGGTSSNPPAGFSGITTNAPFFNNYGTLNVTGTGTFQISGGQSTGTFNYTPDLAFVTNLYRVAGGTTFTGPGPVVLRNNGGIDAAAPVRLPRAFIQFAGFTLGNANMFVDREFEWSGGTIGGTGTLEFGPECVTTIVGSGAKVLERQTINNRGIVTWTGPGNIEASNNATWNNFADSTFDVKTDAALTGTLENTPTWNNDAGSTFKKSAGTGTTSIGINFNNSGLVDLQAGTTQFYNFHQLGGVTKLNGGNLGSVGGTPFIADGGSIVGNGTMSIDTIIGNLQANFSPGLSPGKITINGNYTQKANGILRIEVAGLTTPGVDFDQLAVTGTATLGGSLRVTDINGFKPGGSDTIIPLTAGAITGTFSSTNAQVNYGSTSLTVAALPTPLSQLLNISTRMRVLTGENVLIGGFIITGSEAKKVMVRGIGPSLKGAGVQGELADPTLELHQGSTTLTTNDNWKTRPDGSSQQAEIEATTIPPANDLESALVTTLAPGAYTAILAGKNGGTGVGLVEAYDLGQGANSQVANISTRGFIDTGDNVMIGGVIAGPTNALSSRMFIRAIGPSLQNAGVANPLQDPTLELHNGSGATIATNDNWKMRPDGSSQQAEIEATTIPPTTDLESALLQTLAPGNYTAIVRGKNNTTGVGLVEVYNLQ